MAFRFTVATILLNSYK